jgi:hypothetical protein
VNQIKDPVIHEAAINVIVEVVDIILRAEEELDYADYESGMCVRAFALRVRSCACVLNMRIGSLPPQLSLINIFGPRLFEACELDRYFLFSPPLSLSPSSPASLPLSLLFLSPLHIPSPS